MNLFKALTIIVASSLLGGCAIPPAPQPTEFFKEGAPRATMELESGVRESRISLAGKPYCVVKFGFLKNSFFPVRKVLETHQPGVIEQAEIPAGPEVSFSAWQPIHNGHSQLDFSMPIEPGAVYRVVFDTKRDFGIFVGNFKMIVLKDGKPVPIKKLDMNACAAEKKD